MKVQRVYTDTSVIGGYFDTEFAPWSRAIVQDFQHGRRALVVSDLTTAEIEDAPANVQALYADLLRLAPEVLALNPAVEQLAALYQQRGIVSSKYYDDGVHIAFATIAEVDVLVSWNFKHIVHLDKIRLFNAVNLEQGYKPLVIYSPREVASYDNEEREGR
jgi:hypothetical protein